MGRLAPAQVVKHSEEVVGARADRSRQLVHTQARHGGTASPRRAAGYRYLGPAARCEFEAAPAAAETQ